MKGFADVFRLPAPARQPCELVAILERVVALHQRAGRTPAGSPGGGSWTRRRSASAPIRRSSNRPSSTSSRTPSRRSTARGRHGHDPRHVEDGSADARRRGQRRRADGGGAGQPVHAVLQHQAGRPGDRPDAGRRDPRRPRLRLRPRAHRPRHHRLPHHVHLTTDDSGVPPRRLRSPPRRLRSRLGNPNKLRGFLATTPESCDDSGVVPGTPESSGRQWTRKVTPVHCFTPPAPVAGVQSA